MAEIKKYQPSNGTEGDYFTDKFCMQCMNCNPDPEGKKQCDILMSAFAYSITDPEYPTEWQYNDKDEPCCTAWKAWNWDKLGNPDDPDNPNYVMPFNPDQTNLFEE